MPRHRHRKIEAADAIEEAWFFRETGDKGIANVVAFSENRFCFTTLTPPAIGEQIWLRVPRHGDLPGTVDWLDGHNVRGTFLYRSPASSADGRMELAPHSCSDRHR